MAGQTQSPATVGFSDEISADPFAGLNDMPFLELLSRATSGSMSSMDVATSDFRHDSDSREGRSESWSAKFMTADIEAAGGSIQWPSSSGNSLMTQGATRNPTAWDNGLNAPYGTVAEYDFGMRDSWIALITPQRDRKAEGRQVGEDPDNTMNQSTEDGGRKNSNINTRIEDHEPRNDKQCTEAGFSFISSTDPKEMKSPEQGSNEENNLKTPQQRPRKRKHRPKVVKQGESKRMPKQATPKPKNPTPKRKYVKRKGINDQTSDAKLVAGATDGPEQHCHTKRSSRRALNFELDEHSGEKRESSCRMDLTLDLDDQAQETSSLGPRLNMNSVWHEQQFSASTDQSYTVDQRRQGSTATNKEPQTGPPNENQQASSQMKNGREGSQKNVNKLSSPGKGKRMPKQATPNSKSLAFKRKYVRRKGIDDKTSENEKVTGENDERAKHNHTKRSTRRASNFEQDNQPRDGGESSCRSPTLDLDDQLQKNSRKPGLNVNSVMYQHQFSSSRDQSYSVEQSRSTAANKYPQPDAGLPNENLETRYQVKDGTEGAYEITEHDKRKPVNKISNAQRSATHPKCSSFAKLDEQESAKKEEHYYTVDHAYKSIMDLFKAEYKLLQGQAVGVADSGDKTSCTNFSESYMEIYEKTRSVELHNSIAANTPSPVVTSRFIVEETREGLLFDASLSTLLASFSPINQSNVEVNATLQEEQVMTHHRLQGNVLEPLHRQKKNRENDPTQVCDLSSLAVIAKSRYPPDFFASPAPVTTGSEQGDDISGNLATCIEALVMKEKAKLARRKRVERMKVTRSKSSAPKHAHWDHSLSVDALTERLKLLDISRQDMISSEECNALVPYGTRYQEHSKLVLYERDGAVVPLDGSLSLLKRRHARPRVDLDEETNRVWNLLLENIDNQGIDGTDEEKVKWWEEERSVFQGRASSFIARMHLVQGDRRFSQWKGSVVDSVVGVFLTQNVSDHLSSSAFMSLAAHFSLKKSSCNQECHEEMVLKGEPEVCIQSDSEQNREETINNNKSCESSTGSLSTSEVSESNLDNCGSGLSETPEKSFTRSECITEEKNRPLEGGLSSEGSVVVFESSPDTSCTHSADGIRPNSETSTLEQDPRNEPYGSCNGSSVSLMELLRMADNLVYFKNPRPQGEFTEPDVNLEDLQIQSESVLAYKQGQDGAFYDSEGALRESNIPSCSHWMNKTEDVQSGLLTTIMDGESLNKGQEDKGEKSIERLICRGEIEDDTTNASSRQNNLEYQEKESKPGRQNYSSAKRSDQVNVATSNDKKRRAEKDMDHAYDWDSLRKQAQEKGGKRERPSSTRDSLDWGAVRCADVNEIAKIIKERGMNNRLGERIKDFLNRLVRDHGSIDLEWLKDVPPDKAKEYLLSIRGLGLKSTECVRLLTLQHLAFPVDTNVGRIAVRLGWVPLQPLPESLQLHLLELYPVMESIQKYLWPRLCKLDQLTLYELHYQMITFGKVFCTKSKPNCNACPMRGECRHFASAFASSRLALPGPQEKSMMIATVNREADQNSMVISNLLELPSTSDDHQAQINKQLQTNQPSGPQSGSTNCNPIIEEPMTPESECIRVLDSDIEDAGWEDPDEIPTIRLNIEEFSQNLQNYVQQSMDLQEGDVSKALVALTSEVASIPMPKLKNTSQLRTEHQVYELPDSHPLLKELNDRELDDPCSYLLAIWTPGEKATSIQPPENKCCSQDPGQMCQQTTCYECNSVREANSQTVRGTLLIPCRTAMRGSFPLNGTYFQVNEVFADHDSSIKPIDVPRDWIWNLPRRTVYFGSSIPTIFKGLSTEEIQHCFWRGYVCVRGFDRKTRAPRPLMARLHFPARKLSKKKGTSTNNDRSAAAPS